MGTAMHSRTEQLPNDSVSDSGSTIAVPVPMTMSMTRFTCLRRIMYAVIALFLIKGIQGKPTYKLYTQRDLFSDLHFGFGFGISEGSAKCPYLFWNGKFTFRFLFNYAMAGGIHYVCDSEGDYCELSQPSNALRPLPLAVSLALYRHRMDESTLRIIAHSEV